MIESKIKTIDSKEDFDKDYSNDDAIKIYDDSEVFNNISKCINNIIMLSKKYPNLEIRICNNVFSDESSFNKLITIKNELLKTELKDSNKIKIELPGMGIHNNFRFYNQKEFETRPTIHTMKEVFETEKVINQIVEDIKKYNFTPFEMTLASYIIVTQFKDYKETKSVSAQSRSIYSIMFNDYIVCEGYSRLLNNILSKLGIPSSEIIFNSNYGGHAISLIDLEDDKYGVYGKYLYDPTLDNHNKGKNNLNDGISPVKYFAMSYFEFENKYRGILVKDLYFLNNGEELLPALDEEDDLRYEVNIDSINKESLKECYLEVYSKIFNTDMRKDTKFNESMDEIFNNKNISK